MKNKCCVLENLSNLNLFLQKIYPIYFLKHLRELLLRRPRYRLVSDILDNVSAAGNPGIT